MSESGRVFPEAFPLASPELCQLAITRYADGMSWGSDSISCIRPKDELSTLFYASSNQMQAGSLRLTRDSWPATCRLARTT